MTENMIDLPGMIAKSDDADFLRELIQDAAQRLMDIEVAAVCGAGHGERTRCHRTLVVQGAQRRQLGQGHGPGSATAPQATSQPDHNQRQIARQPVDIVNLVHADRLIDNVDATY